MSWRPCWPIDDVNLLVLRQLLKLRIFSDPDEAGRHRFYAPAGDGPAAAAGRRHGGQGDLFHRCPGLDPYLSPERQQLILQHLREPDRLLELVREPRTGIPQAFLSEEPLTEETFAAHIRNRKSSAAVETYYRFYRLLRDFRNAPARTPMSRCGSCFWRSGTFSKRPSAAAGPVFDLGRGGRYGLDRFLEANRDHVLLCAGDFNRAFYRLYSRSGRGG